MKVHINYWIKNFNTKIQHCDKSTLLKEKSFVQLDGNKKRKCNISMFERKTQTGEVIHRTWLCFSPKTGRLYCFFCKLFDESKENQFVCDGFYDWKHASERLIQHETATAHLKALIAFNNLSKQSGRIDMELEKQVESSTQYWRRVLTRVIHVILFLSERGLAFRGKDETLGSPNNGNFLGIIELLSNYDIFLKEHIEKYGNCGSGRVNYLSSTIYEELVEEIGKLVYAEIINRLKKAKIYSVTLDGTSDAGHVDQLTIVFRYIENDTPVERFLQFLSNQGHKAQDMFHGLTNVLKENNISINDCRGQSYDNASPMSGKLNGLQALVVKENPLAIWVPCFAHSLNLTGEKASDSSTHSTNYFLFLQGIYVFFSASDLRWELLVQALKLHATNNNRIKVPQRIDSTRWSCRADSNKAFVIGYKPIKETLLSISENKDYDAKTRCEALGYYQKMCQLETGIMASFWFDILENLNNTSKTLQSSHILLNTAISCVKSLKKFIADKRDSFTHYERLGIELTDIEDYTNHRIRRSNVRLEPLDHSDSRAPEVEFTPAKSFRIRHYIPIVDTFVNALDKRISAYEEADLRFGFLSNFNKLTLDEISENSKNLLSIYKNDLDSNLEMELIQFQEFCANLLKFDPKNNISREQSMYSLIINKGVRESFPNVEMVLRIYLTLMISNCSGERSFSKLKLIKNTLRTSMSQERLNNLTIMCTERDVVRDLDIETVIKKFSEKKARKCII